MQPFAAAAGTSVGGPFCLPSGFPDIPGGYVVDFSQLPDFCPSQQKQDSLNPVGFCRLHICFRHFAAPPIRFLYILRLAVPYLERYNNLINHVPTCTAPDIPITGRFGIIQSQIFREVRSNGKMIETLQSVSVPQALRRAKDAAGETNRSLAEKSGIPEHTVAKIMSGVIVSPTFDQVAALAAVLDLDLNALAGFQVAAPYGEDAAVAQAHLDGANQLLELYRERLAIFDRGVHQRNLAICALMGFLAFFAAAFVIYVIMDANDPQHGFIRAESTVNPMSYLMIAIPVLAALIAGHVFVSRRIRAARNR